MHIVTGLVLSAIASRLMDKKEASGKAGQLGDQIQVGRAIPGRIRMYSAKIKDQQFSEALREQLLKVDGIQAAEVNVSTGSLLVSYDVEVIEQPLLIAAVQKLTGSALPEETPDRSAIMQEVQLLGRATDAAIMEKTGGLVDINTVVTGTFLILGIKELIKNRSLGLPAPITLFYWVYTLSGFGRKA